MSFSAFVFFAVMFLTTVGTRSREDCRDSWHSGFWPIKVTFWLGLLIVPFFMPSGVFKVYGKAAELGPIILRLTCCIRSLSFAKCWSLRFGHVGVRSLIFSVRYEKVCIIKLMCGFCNKGPRSVFDLR
jgi:hypothetical protein